MIGDVLTSSQLDHSGLRYLVRVRFNYTFTDALLPSTRMHQGSLVGSRPMIFKISKFLAHKAEQIRCGQAAQCATTNWRLETVAVARGTKYGADAQRRIWSVWWLKFLISGRTWAHRSSECHHERQRRAQQVPFECPSFSIALEKPQLQQIVDFSGCVKAIETWKTEHMYNRMEDSVKKAILESIIDAYNIYQNEADRMRREWTFQCCINDWRYRTIETALLAGSTAMHQLLVSWLLDAKLAPAERTRWFIRPKIVPSSDDPTQLQRPRHSFNNSVLSAAQLTMNGIALLNMSIAADTTTNHETPIMWASQHQQQLVLSVQLDARVLPAPFCGEELPNMIMDIGRKVHFLKTLRPAHASNEQQQLLCAQLPTNVWCTPSDISRMADILRQMHAEVSEEMSQELMGRQRLMDHLCLVHGYFFMLRSDFASALEHILFIKTARTTATKKCATPLSSRKMLCGVILTKREQMKCKILSEQFMLRSRLREGQRNEFQAVAEFFSTDALRAYKRVFGFVSNLQLQRAQLDYMGQNLLRVVLQWLVCTKSECFSTDWPI
ncbi:hypothetical protein niasHT_039912 [Heterodera trifolii]|uniref:Uncharacterized protein n=1 Tax=Heterodera trifolii TaxID=157864 RepID=A0ABD2IB15_9BILA